MAQGSAESLSQSSILDDWKYCIIEIGMSHLLPISIAFFSTIENKTGLANFMKWVLLHL